MVTLAMVGVQASNHAKPNHAQPTNTNTNSNKNSNNNNNNIRIDPAQPKHNPHHQASKRGGNHACKQVSKPNTSMGMGARMY